MYDYVICEYEKVKEEFPQFKTVMENCRAGVLARASADWSPLTYGGMNPMAGQFGESTIMPELFYGFLGTGGTRLRTWLTNYTTALASNCIMQGRNAGLIPEDYKIGLCGLAFLSKPIRVSEIKFQIGDTKHPRINIEEAYGYNKPAIIFEDWYLLDEETGFEMVGYVNSRGNQRLKLIGVQLNRVPNKLQTTDCGAYL